MSDAESSTQTATCPLLKLPPEIRNRIWTLVVKVGTVHIKADCYWNAVCPIPSGKHISPTPMAVAFTCQKIYREVTPIYYSKNIFHFPRYSPFDFPHRFAAAIGPANTESIAEVETPYTLHPILLMREYLDMHLPFLNLKALWCFRSDCLHCGFSPPTNRCIMCRTNLLETQPGGWIKEPHGQSHVVEANPEDYE